MHSYCESSDEALHKVFSGEVLKGIIDGFWDTLGFQIVEVQSMVVPVDGSVIQMIQYSSKQQFTKTISSKQHVLSFIDY